MTPGPWTLMGEAQEALEGESPTPAPLPQPVMGGRTCCILRQPGVSFLSLTASLTVASACAVGGGTG